MNTIFDRIMFNFYPGLPQKGYNFQCSITHHNDHHMGEVRAALTVNNCERGKCLGQRKEQTVRCSDSGVS